MKVDDVRKAIDAALREVNKGDNHLFDTDHPWGATVGCAAHAEWLSCCLDPEHEDYESLLDYLAERVARELSTVTS